MLRGIFRKRRHLLHLLFQTAIECLRDAFCTRLGLPEGRIAAAAAVHTFGDSLVFHPHLHLFADWYGGRESNFLAASQPGPQPRLRATAPRAVRGCAWRRGWLQRSCQHKCVPKLQFGNERLDFYCRGE